MWCCCIHHTYLQQFYLRGRRHIYTLSQQRCWQDGLFYLGYTFNQCSSDEPEMASRAKHKHNPKHSYGLPKLPGLGSRSRYGWSEWGGDPQEDSWGVRVTGEPNHIRWDMGSNAENKGTQAHKMKWEVRKLNGEAETGAGAGDSAQEGRKNTQNQRGTNCVYSERKHVKQCKH